MDMAGNDALRALAAARTRPWPHPPTPQCQHPVPRITGPDGFPKPESIDRQTARMVAQGKDPALCAHRSSYLVGGRHYCGQHAGMVALDLLITAGLAAEIHPD